MPIAKVMPVDADQETDSRSRATTEIETSMAEIFRAGRTWSKELAGQFLPELSPVGFGILRHVMNADPVRSHDIVEAFGMDKGSVSRTITGLRELGLVETTVDPEDRRSTLISGTAKAEAAFAKFRDEAHRRYHAILAEWPTQDVAAFAALLHRFDQSFT
jgi:DNA-binding MarR family transcriptional regulator